MIDSPVSLEEPLIFTRTANGRQYFLCDRCGDIHFHGDVEGHRTSHCKTSEFRVFGRLWEGYTLSHSSQLPGRLTKDEASAAQTVSYQAHRLVSAVRRYLDIAEVDPTSEVSALLQTAERALSKLATIELVTRNPFERITDDNWNEPEEDEN